ncbi:lycopene beta-cyclase [Catalinimonas alkaloidigena]|uniref:Lycopene beta-cyclase n=1 Tax=Catalinimonas alkaloidigena TaxID=1075417 RepID=A0A1G9PPH7_9BACT|nr:FAD-dependent oxidoreductase [Catalinimonas alkaloidigena]SDM00680.1 lycopene beta-cyclase [Catalinimonas alkaloidigena]
MSTYDYILVGGGMAGLTLAYHLAERGLLRDRTLLVLERAPKTTNDRTWCFWTQKPTLFEPIVYRDWQRVAFVSETWHRILPLGAYRYQMIRASDFYRFAQERLAREPNVTWQQAEVVHVQDTPDGVDVRTADGTTHRGRWGFDSRFSPGDVVRDTQRRHYLSQHFKGWIVETPHDYFTPDCPTLFDFRTPQRGVMRFMYVLPFSPRQALVEYTLFSADLLPEAAYDEALHAYLTQVLGVTEYSILEEEKGIIPMWDHPFARNAGAHVLNLGTRGGLTKPSTGYTFLRAQHDAQRITDALVQNNQPFHGYQAPARYRTFDTMLLQILYRHGERAAPIFTDLFRHNPTERLLRFLDEETSFGEDLQVMASVPPWPFIRAFWQAKIRQKV